MRSWGWKAFLCSHVFWHLGSLGFVTGQEEAGGGKKRLQEKALLLSWYPQRSVIHTWPAEPWLVHCVHPHAQGPLSLMPRSPQGDTLQLSLLFTPEAPADAAHSQGLVVTNGCCSWQVTATAHGPPQL